MNKLYWIYNILTEEWLCSMNDGMYGSSWEWRPQLSGFQKVNVYLRGESSYNRLVEELRVIQRNAFNCKVFSMDEFFDGMYVVVELIDGIPNFCDAIPFCHYFE